jgi:hypothetical protein
MSIRLLALIAAIAAVVTHHPHHRPKPHRIAALWVHDAICETGSTPPNWRFHVGIYQGGIAFYAGTWDTWKQHVPTAHRFGDADQAPAWVQAAVAQWGLDHFGRWGCLFHPDVWAYSGQ